MNERSDALKRIKEDNEKLKAEDSKIYFQWQLKDCGGGWVTEGLEDLSELVHEILAMEDDDQIVIKKIELTEEEYENLPDFEGF